MDGVPAGLCAERQVNVRVIEGVKNFLECLEGTHEND